MPRTVMRSVTLTADEWRLVTTIDAAHVVPATVQLMADIAKGVAAIQAGRTWTKADECDMVTAAAHDSAERGPRWQQIKKAAMAERIYIHAADGGSRVVIFPRIRIAS